MPADDGASLRRERRQSTPIAPAYRGRVVQPPAGAGEPLTVEAVDAPGAADPCHEWPAKTPLPVAGDECLVIYDIATEPWIVAWSIS